MRHDDLLRNSRQLKQRRIFRQWLWFASSLTAFLVIVIIMANTSRFAIGEIKISGAQTIREQDIETTINSVLDGRYGGIFPRRNVWLFPKADVVAALRAQYPNLAAVSVALSDKTTLVAKVAERAGTVRWCRDETEVTCYFADQNGYIFSESPEFSRGIFLSIVSDLPTDPIDLAPLETADFKILVSLREAMARALSSSSQSPVNIFQIQHEEGRDYALIAESSSPERRYRVRISLDQDLDQAANNAAAALAAPALQSELAKKETKLDYLDLRFAPKIFYKFQPGI